MKTYRIGVIGFGNIGTQWVRAIRELGGGRWEVAYICETAAERRAAAAELAPEATVVGTPDAIYADPTVDVVGSFAIEDSRPEQVRQALAAGKHLIIEKPIAPDTAAANELLRAIRASDRLVAVNLFNRNAWYHHRARAFVDSGQIGRVGILRLCHMTAGRIPGWGHGPEVPPLHTCGMHYLDIARWYARSEYDRWHAIGVRMWGEPRPWWGSVHGHFRNGVAFELTNGFVYGHQAKDPIVHSSFECIGTEGVVRFEHDFKTVRLQMHGTSETIDETGPYGGKKFDVMLDLMARSLDAGRDLGLPSPEDAVVAYDIAGRMQADAERNSPPAIGTQDDLAALTASKRQRVAALSR